ncbi:NAD(P)/FAD-dependent oxidoreductase [Cobetia sp. cqz5-12]|uniref:NAD(P)/FAD-dependent oxidoreductase n=1 Tax=Cobetia sp. cqz5-12 TaxID=2609415 RepID=UPI001905CC99|nr:FAD-dependent oxidoreductase [Cobetia sp. cqz5-12]
MSDSEHTEVAVIGAGAVGVACALWLRRSGHEVTMIEREGIASGTSFGNASTLADYGCLPIARPEIWRSMPSLLLSPDSPFVIDWKCLPRLSPWLMRFMGQCNATRFRANSEMLARLLSHTYTDYQPLLDDAPAAAAMIQRKGCLYAYGKAENLQAAQGDIRLRDQLGIHQQVLTADELIALEPAMAGHTAGGVLFPSSCHLDDPQVFIDTLAAPLREEGRLVTAEVIRLSSQASGMLLEYADGRRLMADRVVLAAGAWSAHLARQIGDRIPLDTERGYHIEFDLEHSPLNRPTCPVESAFYMTPLRGAEGPRLRVAGTVELSSLAGPANPARFDYLETRVRRVLGLDAPVARRWLGFRPTLPDSIPVIGPSPNEPRVIHAFGHQHIGVTLAGVTGRLVSECLAKGSPEWITPCSPARF